MVNLIRQYLYKHFNPNDKHGTTRGRLDKRSIPFSLLQGYTIPSYLFIIFDLIKVGYINFHAVSKVAQISWYLSYSWGKTSIRKLTRLGIEPGPARWDATTLPLHYRKTGELTDIAHHKCPHDDTDTRIRPAVGTDERSNSSYAGMTAVTFKFYVGVFKEKLIWITVDTFIRIRISNFKTLIPKLFYKFETDIL